MKTVQDRIAQEASVFWWTLLLPALVVLAVWRYWADIKLWWGPM